MLKTFTSRGRQQSLWSHVTKTTAGISTRAPLKETARKLGLPSDCAWMARRLGKQLGSIQYGALEPCDQPVTGTTDFEFLCSYSWGKIVPKPTICVPGDAPSFVLHPLPKPVSVRSVAHEDIAFYRDANVAHSRDAPWRPMFQALQIMRPGYKLDDVDLIINRNVLKQLLLFADGKSTKNFRVNIDMIQNTMLVTPSLSTGHDGPARDFGRMFEHVFTKNASKKQRGTHHRAIRYKIGPLNCIVLFECDAQIDNVALRSTKSDGFRWLQLSLSDVEQTQYDQVPQQLQSKAEDELRRFNELLAADHERHVQDDKFFRLVRDGQGTLSTQIAELSVKAVESNKSPSKIAQMWLGRTPYLIIGKYRGTAFDGAFTGLTVHPSWAQLQRFEGSCQDSLRKLVSALKLLKHWVSTTPHRACAAVRARPDSNLLRIFSFENDLSPGGHSGFKRQFWSRPPKKSRWAPRELGHEPIGIHRARSRARQRQLLSQSMSPLMKTI